MSRPSRIAVGGIAHETNTFVPTPTTLADVRQRTLLTGDALQKNARGTDGALGGIIDAAEGRVDLLPTLFASAAPGGPLDAGAYRTLRDDLIGRLNTHSRRFPGIDGVVLVLHGAMVVDGIDDAEGALLHDVRQLIGPRPLVVVVDFHANLSQMMVETADLIVPYRTYPHVDTRACGAEALDACLAMIRGTLRPVTAWRPLPIRFPLPAQATEGSGAFARLARRARQLSGRDGVHATALIPGFPYSDVREACASVLVTTDNDPALAHEIADELASAWWQARAELQVSGLTLEQLPPLLAKHSTREDPIVLADIADNPGAGAPGDSTWLLHALFDNHQSDVALATLIDPGAVAACHRASVGARLRLDIGGTRSPWSGTPLGRTWSVRSLGEGVFANQGPIGRGSITRLGRTATIESDGISVILCERRLQTLEPATFLAGGIDPEAMRVLVVKSSVHYRAAFGEIASAMVDVETPGLCTSQLETLPWLHPMASVLDVELAHV